MGKINYGEKARQTQETRKEQDTMATPAPAMPQPSKESAEANLLSEQLPSGRPVARNNVYTAQIGIRVSPKQRKYLKQLALDNDTTINVIIRDLIERLADGDIQLGSYASR